MCRGYALEGRISNCNYLLPGCKAVVLQPVLGRCYLNANRDIKLHLFIYLRSGNDASTPSALVPLT